MALSAWRLELALQAIHGPAAGCASNLLVCRYPRVRGGLSLIPAISYAVFCLKKKKHKGPPRHHGVPTTPLHALAPPHREANTASLPGEDVHPQWRADP